MNVCFTTIAGQCFSVVTSEWSSETFLQQRMMSDWSNIHLVKPKFLQKSFLFIYYRDRRKFLHMGYWNLIEDHDDHKSRISKAFDLVFNSEIIDNKNCIRLEGLRWERFMLINEFRLEVSGLQRKCFYSICFDTAQSVVWWKGISFWQLNSIIIQNPVCSQQHLFHLKALI